MFFTRKPKSAPTIRATAFIYSYARRSRKSAIYKGVYRTIARKLEAYEASRGIEVQSNNFSIDMAEDFAHFMLDGGLMKNTVAGYMSKVSHMFRRMAKAGYAVDFSFEDFKIEEEETCAVYITTAEIAHIYAHKFKHKSTEIIRDRFVANCLTGMRYSDFSDLTAANVRGGVILRKTAKKGVPVEVPMHRIVAEILQKYGGNFPPCDSTKQNYNKVIKTICRRAGLTDSVLWERTVGHKVVRKTFKRYEMVGSHTARRSFATNAYLAGIPVFRIMLITGHKTEAAFFKYIRIGRRENALALAEHDFFR